MRLIGAQSCFYSLYFSAWNIIGQRDEYFVYSVQNSCSLTRNVILVYTNVLPSDKDIQLVFCSVVESTAVLFSYDCQRQVQRLTASYTVGNAPCPDAEV